MIIKPFRAWRPSPELVSRVASVPYDVVDREQASQIAQDNPYSFLHVIRAEIDLDDSVDQYDDSVYVKAKDNLNKFIHEKILIQENEDSLYLYSQKMHNHVQFGIVATCHFEDYESGKIKIHEKTRRVKEQDRINYVDSQNANTGPVFLAYRNSEEINDIVMDLKNSKPLYHFISDDEIEHTVWKFNKPELVVEAFKKIDCAYVADGHHRSASAAKIGAMRRDNNPNHNGSEGYNYFLAVLFPDIDLKILAYNRVILSLPNTIDNFRTKLAKTFIIEANGKDIPSKSGEICMYFEGVWNTLILRKEIVNSDPVSSLDVSILQNYLLEPILEIYDPRESDNIDFVGGIKGTKELMKWVDSGRAVIAFSMFPTSMNELFSVADAGMLMPPKSTWFEPKLRSGLLINKLD